MIDVHGRPAYGNLATLKSAAYLKDPASGDSWDAPLFRLLVAASDWIDQWTGRIYYPIYAQVGLNGNGTAQIDLPAPFQMLRGVLLRQETPSRMELQQFVDWRGGGGFGSNSPIGEGHTFVRRLGGAVWERGYRNYTLQGYFGYRLLVAPQPTVVAANVLDQDATTIVVSGDVNCGTGDTLIARQWGDDPRIPGDSPEEVMVVRDVNGQNLTVERHLGYGRFTALRPAGSVNANFKGLLRVIYPPSIEAAAMITAARWFTRSPDFEPFYVDTDLDTDVKLLLAPFRRVADQIL